MGALDNQPENPNLLNPNGFRFIIKRLPNVVYFCQTAPIPAISIPVAPQPTAHVTIPQPGSKLIYEPLVLTFKVDENLNNYLEIHNWMVGEGHPYEFKQVADLIDSSEKFKVKPNQVSAMKSDATLIVLTSAKNASTNVFFYDMFPTSLSELKFRSNENDVDYLEATVEFKYTRYVIERI